MSVVSQVCCGESLMSALCRNVSAQAKVAQTSSGASSDSNDVLIRENEQLRKELQVYIQKAARLQKVSEKTPTLLSSNSFCCHRNAFGFYISWSVD